MGRGTPSAFGSSPCKGERGMLARQAWVVSIHVNTPKDLLRTVAEELE